MNSCKIPVSFVTVTFFLFSYVASLSDTEKDQVNRGLDAGGKLVNLLSSNENFHSKLREITAKASQYLSAINPLIGFILSFFGSGESAELRFMKNAFSEVNRKLDRYAFQIEEVRRLIDWRTMEVTYANDEKGILALEAVFKNFVSAPNGKMVDTYRKEFINMYGMHSAALIDLYNALTMDEGWLIFTRNVVRAAMKYTEYDRGRVQSYMLGVTQLVIRGVQLEVAYYRMKYGITEADHQKRLWDDRLAELRRKMNDYDNDLMREWHVQSGKDLERLALEQHHVSNKDFSKNLHVFLTNKYFWRTWYVLVYDPVSGWNTHTVWQCNGHTRFRLHGKNIVVASTQERRFNQGKAVEVLNALSQRVEHRNDAKNWYDFMAVRSGGNSCDAGYAMKAVICTDCHAWSCGSLERCAYRTVYAKFCTHNCKRMSIRGQFRVILFG